MTDKPKHSPTPWEFEEIKTFNLHHVDDAKGQSICDMYFKTGRDNYPEFHRKANAEANAKHIVHCVNNHDALVEALRDIAGLNDVDGNSQACDSDDEMRYRAERALQALANAKGESDERI